MFRLNKVMFNCLLKHPLQYVCAIITPDEFQEDGEFRSRVVKLVIVEK